MPSPACSGDPGELIARYLDANPEPDDPGPCMTTDQLAEQLGLDRPADTAAIPERQPR